MIISQHTNFNLTVEFSVTLGRSWTWVEFESQEPPAEIGSLEREQMGGGNIITVPASVLVLGLDVRTRERTRALSYDCFAVKQ